ncbi:carbohydrate sulfotransferase 3-like [Argopecten irradians]|uniref:carbohydrate sulfotransferase 3-like n=1 Tax=Argopecten irradians TaxID=31199 RepID=UPI0037143E16
MTLETYISSLSLPTNLITMAGNLPTIFALILSAGCCGILMAMYFTNQPIRRPDIVVCPPVSSDFVHTRKVFRSTRKISNVLIITHPRSGSTFTGDIIQKSKDSFYAFEPLRFVAESMELGQPVVFLNGSRRVYNYTQDAAWVEADLLYRWFTCDFCRINLKDLQSKFIGSFSTNLHNYARCLKRYNVYPMSRCIMHLQRTCEKAKVRSVKTVRLLNLESVPILLKMIPDLKVIYLVRDPRGRLASQAALDPKEWNIVQRKAKDMCSQLYEEFNHLIEIEKYNTNRLKFIIYEKIALDPIQMSKRMFMFLDMNFSINEELFVKSITRAAFDKSGCYWCTKRTNSNETATRWRKTIDFGYVKTIDFECIEAYNALGYTEFTDESHLRNMSVSLTKEAYNQRIFL